MSEGKSQGILLLAFLGLALSICAAARAQAPAPIGAYTTKGAYTFVSAPKLHPPIIHTDGATQTKKLAPGYFMVASFKNLTLTQSMVGQSGSLILDKNLQPVWFNPAPTNVLALNLRAQTYHGKPALSWWQGVINNVGATLSGEDIVVDKHYRQVATLVGHDGWVISEHEMLISGHYAWVTAYRNVPADLTAYGGLANGVLTDSAVQQYDLKTARLRYTWDAFNPGGTPNIPLSQSATRPAAGLVNGHVLPWDAYHVNSIQLVGDHQFLVSMRNTWAAYLVDFHTGKIVWTLSANPKVASAFTIAPNAGFRWQHDVELQPGNHVSVFDDACCLVTGPDTLGPPSGPSRALVLKLNAGTHTATLVDQYTRGRAFDAAFLGNANLQPNGNMVVGWGSQPYFSEYSKSGKRLLDAVWPTPDLSYRAYAQKWVGTPFFPPSGAVRKVIGRTTVYASWDGATQVVGWRVLAGSSVKHLTLVATKAKAGFETAIRVQGSYNVFKVQAVDARGHVIGTSKGFTVPRPGAAPLGPGFY